jgi:Arc/MetJ family transcription regulator
MLVLALMTMMVAAVVVLFPETKVARSLTHWLIEAPAQWLNRTAVWRILFYGGLIAGGFLAALLFEAEGLVVYRAMASEVMIWSMMFDVGVVIDALLITTAVMATNGLRVVKARVETLTRRVSVTVATRFAARATRPRRPVRPGRKAADDEGLGWAQPAYRAFSMA